MPEMGESVTEGIVLEWHVAVGDFVNEGDTVVEVSTDKVDAEVPAPTDGVITKLVVSVDDEVPVGAPLAEMEPGDGDGTAREASNGSAAGPGTTSEGPAGGGDASVLGPSESAPPAGEATRADGGAVAGADARATPIARRVAGELGVDLSAVAGSGPGAKVTKEDVIAAADGGGNGAAPAAEAKALRGPAAMLAKAMDESREVPTATSFRTIAVDTLDAKRKALNGVLNERGMKVSFTHIVAWAITQAAKGFPVMVRSFAERRRQAGGDRGQPRQPRHRRRRRAQGRVPQPDGSRDQGRGRSRLRRLPLLLRGPDQQDPREQAHRRRLPGHEHLADQPGRDRHPRLGPAPDEGAERDHRDRVDRLPAGVVARHPGPDARARRLQGDDADLDIRPPGDPGGGVGSLPASRRAAPAGRGRLLRVDRRRPRHRGGADRRRPPRLGLRAAARRPRSDDPGEARRGAAAGRAGGDGPAQGLPHARAPGSATRSPRLRAQGRPRDPAGEPRPHPRADGAHPGLDPAHRRPRRNAARGPSADARSLLRHDRLPVRAPLLPPAAHLVAGYGRDRRPSPAAGARRERTAADQADRRLRIRALRREGLPRAEDLHDRGARRGRADARRARHPGPPQRRRGGRLRDGAPRPPRRARPQPRALGRVDPRRVRGGEADRGGEGGGGDPTRRHRRRQVPLRPSGRLRDERRREDRRPPLPEPEPPRVRQPRGRGGDPLHPVRLRRPEARARAEARRPRPAARRRRVPRAGRGRRDAQPAGAEGLLDRRHRPHHPEQPGGLHHRPRGRPLDPVRRGHGEGLQRPDRPRQRRRRRGVLGGDQAGDGLSRALGTGHRHRRDRLPPLRSQRDRRARLHPAAGRRQDQGPSARLRDLRGEAGRGGRGLTRAGGGDLEGAPRGDVLGAQGPAQEDGGGATTKTRR